MKIEMNTIQSFVKDNKWFISLFTVLIILRLFIFSVYKVEGASMMNTFEHNDIVIGSQITKVDRFDIVVFKVPEKKKNYIKRVIGLPGDTIEYIDSILYVNGEKVDEPYLTDQVTQDLKVDSIPEGYLYCLGDNRKNSVDSRKIGLIPEENLLSEIKIILFPFEKITTF
ncbi:signal peptidase I [Facklamia miroungae]|uniref:Signal peptidase I n=1 Tax=Facklamia miroungae TaxID=120956 RepID=A0A1G7QV26_9LACT|nr:signal peptidase I [Facklamia miroungae]NKZ29056.1 signal peptidase I [Facklamia miroungae]SDG01729.1 signal peptidase I [Facklamia miroungae]